MIGKEMAELASHELRTPLTSIIGYLDLVLDGEAGAVNEEQREYLSTAYRNARRLQTVIGELLKGDIL